MEKQIAESLLLTPVEVVHQLHHGIKNNERLISYDKKSALPPQSVALKRVFEIQISI